MIKKIIHCKTNLNLQNNSTFHSEESLVNLERGRECFVGLSILLFYARHLPAALPRPLVPPPGSPGQEGEGGGAGTLTAACGNSRVSTVPDYWGGGATECRVSLIFDLSPLSHPHMAKRSL